MHTVCLLHSHSPVAGMSSGVVFSVLRTRLAGLCAGLGSAASVKVKPAVMEQLQQLRKLCDSSLDFSSA